jgi:hypothetical protein
MQSKILVIVAGSGNSEKALGHACWFDSELMAIHSSQEIKQ